MQKAGLVLFACVLPCGAAPGAAVATWNEVHTIPMTYYGMVGQSTVYRGNVGALELGPGRINSVVVTDAGSGGGSSGVFSGFDLDFVAFDADGVFGTADDAFVNVVGASMTVGAVRRRGTSRFQPTASHPGPLFGVNPDGSPDLATATLGRHDASYVAGPGLSVDGCRGWITLGDGGQLVAEIDPVATDYGLDQWIYVADAGRNDEQMDARVDVLFDEATWYPLYTPPPDACEESPDQPEGPLALVADAGGPYVAFPGPPLVLDGSGSSADVLEWRWFIDGLPLPAVSEPLMTPIPFGLMWGLFGPGTHDVLLEVWNGQDSNEDRTDVLVLDPADPNWREWPGPNRPPEYPGRWDPNYPSYWWDPNDPYWWQEYPGGRYGLPIPEPVGGVAACCAAVMLLCRRRAARGRG